MPANFTPSPDQLREILPGVARNMENELIRAQIRDLNIKFKSRNVRGALVVEIPMKPHHMMRISPLNIDFATDNKYISYQEERAAARPNREVVTSKTETYSARIEIIDLETEGLSEPVVITLRKRNMQIIITSAMQENYQITGVKLMPERRMALKRRPMND